MNPKNDTDDAGEEQFENKPSSYDELTHAEMCLLYGESTRTIRFAKYLQWWTLGSTLVVDFSFLAIAKFVSADSEYANKLTALIIVLTTAVIGTLIIYQFWQYNELLKIEKISKGFSTAFRSVRVIKSKLEANIHRYLLLLFMIMTVIMGSIVSYYGVLQIAEGR